MDDQLGDKLSCILKTVEKKLPIMYQLSESYEVKLLKYSENITCLVTDEKQMLKGVLRINRPHYHTLEELIGEVTWMEEIKKDTDLILPQIYKGIDGELIQSFVEQNTTYYCSMFSFLEGNLIREMEGEELLQQIENVGKIAATLHCQIENRKSRNELARFIWGYEELLGEQPRWGSWEHYSGLTQENIKLFQRVSSIIKKRLERYGKDKRKYGLIHADLHLSNIIVNHEKIQVFDFDDCGYSWYLYDLGCSLVQYSKNLECYVHAWIKGYEEIRSVTKEDKQEIPTFLLMRRLARLGWMSTRSKNDTVKEVGEDYLKATIDMAEKYLQTMTE